MGDAGDRSRPESAAPIRPGALTALLAELARAPAAAGWDLPAVAGETIGRFEIVRELGRGGFGVVYEARDTELGRSVAFKAVRAGSTDEARELRALAEAEAAARLAHPNLVHLYDVGRCERGPFLIMELLRGEPLDERLARGPLPAREAVRIAVEIARGVAHAHGQGVVHRDLKPGNVFLCEDGQVKVLDFGLAHVFGRGGASGGTPGYMAPEQAAGETGDERADVYALGVILHELVTGKRPFEGREPGLAAEARPPELAGTPAALGRLLARMLARDPARRPAEAVETLGQLAAIQRAMEPRRLLRAALSVAVAAVLGAGLFAWLWQRPLPPGRLLTAIADTDNQTGDPDLDGVSELLRMGLEQSGRLSVMSRSRLVNLLRAERGSAPGPIGEPEARSAARSARALLVVVPAVREARGGYDLEVRLVDPERGETLTASRERATAKATIPEALDRLSHRVRVAVREPPDGGLGASVRIAEAAPANPEAWHLYAEWRRLVSEGRPERGDALERLLQADPEFPIARAVKAVTSEEDIDAAFRHMDAALRNVTRVPPKERALVEALAVPFQGGSQFERLQRLDAVIASWPEEPLAHVWAGNILLHQYADAQAARPYLERALAIAPLSPGARLIFLPALGRLDEALAVARRWADEVPSPDSLGALAQVHRIRGEVDEALAVARRSLALESRPDRDRRWAWVDADALGELDALLRGSGEERDPHWLALRGRWREALAAFDARAPGPSASDAARGWHHWLRSDLLASGFGDPDAVWREVEEQFGTELVLRECAVLPLAVSGDMTLARRVVRGLGPHEGSGCFRMYEAFDRWRRGDREGALRGFEGVIGLGSNLHRGAVLAELGRDHEAVEAFRRHRRVIDFPWGEMRYIPFTTAASYPRSLLLEAASLERLGERDEALAVVERLLRLWERADADLPHLREAHALRRRLAAAPGR